MDRLEVLIRRKKEELEYGVDELDFHAGVTRTAQVYMLDWVLGQIKELEHR